MSLAEQAKRYYLRTLFEPGLLSLLINPFYLIRSGLYRGIRKYSVLLVGRVMDFGCGSKPYRNLFTAATEYVGVDMQVSGHDHRTSVVDVYYDGKVLPFPDGHFDGIFSSEVFEHIFEIDVVLIELARVTRAGGKMLITIPFVWHEHEAPYDFARYTSFGIKHVLARHGFTVVECVKTGGHLLTCVQAFTAYLHGFVFPRNRYLKIPLSVLIIFPIHLIGYAVNVLMPRNDALFLNCIVLAERK